MTRTMVLNTGKQQALNLLLATIFALLISIPMAFAGAPSEWKNQEFKVKGNWSIEHRADGDYLVVSDDFKTRSAPDLKFFVSKNGYEDITGKNATSNATLISALKSNKGGQSYKIPSNINLNDYQSLIIHCEQYSKLWASTPLK